MLWIARMLADALVRRKINQTCELMWVEITLDAEVDVGGVGRHFLSERFGSGDGERKTLLIRQIAFEPLPASVLFGLLFHWMFDSHGVRKNLESRSQVGSLYHTPQTDL